MGRFLGVGAKKWPWEACWGAAGDALKATTQAITVFAIFVFYLPKGICKEINDIIAQFGWRDEEDNKRMDWLAWWTILFPKSEGGKDFRDLYILLALRCLPSNDRDSYLTLICSTQEF